MGMPVDLYTYTPVCLPEPESVMGLIPGRPAWLVGWGGNASYFNASMFPPIREITSFPFKLQEKKLFLVDSMTCGMTWQDEPIYTPDGHSKVHFLSLMEWFVPTPLTRKGKRLLVDAWVTVAARLLLKIKVVVIF